MKEKDPLNELYKSILNGSAKSGDKERLARWMARFDAPREEIAPEELLQEQSNSLNALKAHLFPAHKSTYPMFSLRSWSIAASLLLTLLAALWITQVKQHPSAEKSSLIYAYDATIAGEHKIITLADGSKIFMNSASKLKYPQSFKGKTREVFLEGQAYFEVNHDQAKPFIVHAGKLTVQVLGTTFDVRNYKGDADAAVTVATGKVAVKTPADKAYWMLNPGQQLSYNVASEKALKLQVKALEYIGWKDGSLVFKNTPLQQIAKQLERAYGVTIIIKTPALEKRKLSLRIKGENIAKVMEMLAVAGDFKYQIKDRIITLWK